MFVFLIGMINITLAKPMPSSEQSNNFYIQALCMVTPSLHSSSCRSPYDTLISCLFSCLTCYMGLGNRIRSNSRFLLWSCYDGSQLCELQQLYDSSMLSSVHGDRCNSCLLLDFLFGDVDSMQQMQIIHKTHIQNIL